MAQETYAQSTFDTQFNQFTPDVFRNPLFGELRVFIDNNNQCWFIGYEVASRLGYSNPRKAIGDHVSNEYKNSVTIRDGNRGNPNIVLIHEEGLYELCLKSELPEAEPFQKWVRKKIKDLRKYGVAMSSQFKTVMEIDEEQAYRAAEQRILEQQQRIDTLQQQNQGLQQQNQDLRDTNRGLRNHVNSLGKHIEYTK